MGTSPTSTSAPLSNAAKADTIGFDGDFTFTKADLLANDAGGARANTFFFGHGDNGGLTQEQYMTLHGITYDVASDTYTAHGGDFEYSVQIGNKGTYSTAQVDVAEAHAGAELFSENFDGYTGQTFKTNGVVASAEVDLAAQHGWTGTENGGAAHTELGVTDVLGGIDATSGDRWLDTQNTPGGIDISHTFTDTTAAIDGKTAVLSFDIAKMDVKWDANNYVTDPNASFEFRVDGSVVAQIDAADFANFNEMKHFDIAIEGSDYSSGTTHTIELVDTTATDHYFGFAIDSIQINDWVV
jgi:hypothetical protein